MLLSWMMLRKQRALTNVETWLLFAPPVSKFLSTCLQDRNKGFEHRTKTQIWTERASSKQEEQISSFMR